MILIINLCKQRLHYYEFVKPIIDIVDLMHERYIVVDYNELKESQIAMADKIIICGTSLQDFDYLNAKQRFGFIKDHEKPVLGICAGMQLICILHGCRLVNGSEIGLRTIMLKDFLGMKGQHDIYELHNKTIKDNKFLHDNFVVYSTDRYVQAVKHKTLPHYGVLFHPEVRNKSLIKEFLRL